MHVLLAFIGFVLFVGLAAAWEGFALSVLWGWFIVPLGAPKITVPLAIGLALVVGMLAHQHAKDDDREWSDLLAHAIVKPPLFLLMGWIVRGFL